ncbi:MAG: pyridoxal phosphate-dependent decarboxylase family protein [Acidimicrobiia bacterium]
MHHFDETTERIAQLCFDYAIDRLRLDPVPLDQPSPLHTLEEQVGQTIAATGHDPEIVLGWFRDTLAPACISCDSPAFLSFIPCAPTKASQLFDIMISASAICGSDWLEAAGAIYAENQALRWLADLAGFPAAAGGTFVSGGSAGNLSALVTARTWAAETRERPARWRVALADTAHSSLNNTLRILDVDPLVVRTGPDDRLTGDALRAALDSDPHHESVCAVVATAGTTNTGTIDDLAGVAQIAHERDVWMHVDGAYGLAGLAAPSVQAKYAGIEHADSFVVDPHKWLFAPFDCAALLYRDPTIAQRAHSQHAAYLDPIRAHEAWDPADYAYQLTRRVRGLPFWFSLAVHGTDAYRDAIEATLAIARDAAARIAAAPHLELVLDPELTIVVFRRIGWDEEQYQAWSDMMLRDQRAFVLPTTHHGERLLRAVYLHPECPPSITDEIVASLATP